MRSFLAIAILSAAVIALISLISDISVAEPVRRLIEQTAFVVRVG